MLERLLNAIFRRNQVSAVGSRGSKLDDLNDGSKSIDGAIIPSTKATVNSNASDPLSHEEPASNSAASPSSSSSKIQRTSAPSSSPRNADGFSNLREIASDDEIAKRKLNAKPFPREWYKMNDTCTRFLPASYVVCDKDPDEMLDHDELRNNERLLLKSSHFLQTYKVLAAHRSQKERDRGSVLLRGIGRRPAAVAIQDQAIVNGKKPDADQHVFFHGGLPGVHETDFGNPLQPLPKVQPKVQRRTAVTTYLGSSTTADSFRPKPRLE